MVVLPLRYATRRDRFCDRPKGRGVHHGASKPPGSHELSGFRLGSLQLGLASLLLLDPGFRYRNIRITNTAFGPCFDLMYIDLRLTDHCLFRPLTLPTRRDEDIVPASPTPALCFMDPLALSPRPLISYFTYSSNSPIGPRFYERTAAAM
ncbi:hypothetical protein F5B21DRAFT_186470 [Xylaria acuta]|nr:hypothetical protein F5B21DRAFT_186470 [Xylaria acuta]